MDDKNKGFAILRDVIIKNKFHQDYDDVNVLADEYKKLFTGKGIKDLLKVYHKRTENDLFDQVCAVYNTIMPEVSNNLARIFSKIFRSNRIFSSIESKDGSAVEEVKEYAARFWSGENDSGLDAYLASRWFYYQIYDPNAFIAVEFNDVSRVTKKTDSIFPVEYSCDEVVNFNYINGILDWLIVRKPIKFRTVLSGKNTWIKGWRYIMYLENSAIQLTKVDDLSKLTTLNDSDFVNETESDVEPIPNADIISLQNNLDYYVKQDFNTLSKGVPAKRVGYILDPNTNQRTCLSIFHAAVSRFKKELKSGSELDLAVALHLHPQKIQFADPCEGDKANGIICNEGRTPNGEICPVCVGTGIKKVGTSAQDIIWVRRPRASDPMPDLTKYVHYIKTDIDVIQFLYNMVNEITEKAKSAIFGSEAVEKKVPNKTATEMDYSMDNVYDTLAPFAMSYSAMWLFTMQKIAIYLNNEVDLYHRFPKDFKLKPLTELMNEAVVANNSGMPQHILDAIHRDIADIIYSDDQATLQKIKIKNRFYPFAGKTQEEISAIIIQNKTTRFNQVLYIHFNQIFEDIDNEIGIKFYISFPYNKAKEEIKRRVDAIILEIDKEAGASIQKLNTQTDIEE